MESERSRTYQLAYVCHYCILWLPKDVEISHLCHVNPLGTEARLSQQLSSAHYGCNARRGKLLTWSFYLLIVSSTIFIQIYNKKGENYDELKSR